MPNRIPNPPPQNVGSSDFVTYPPIPYGAVPVNQQQGFGDLTTLIYPFFVTRNFSVTSSAGSFLYYGTSIVTTSSIDVSDYNNHVFQSFVTSSGASTGSMFVSSSIDGLNWVGEFSFAGFPNNSSSIYRPTSGRRRFFTATYSGSGNATGSIYLLSGQ
jgi:hypothetical protein